MELNSISYGNPTIEQLKALQSNGLVDALFDEFKNNQFPKNDSELTKDELNEIVDYIETVSDTNNVEYLERYKSYDKNLLQVIVSNFKAKGIDVEDLCKSVLTDTKSLLVKLKFFYQRPRPKQLSQYYKLKLFPYKSNTADTPSYPSGHTLQAYVMLNVIANKYPKANNFCQDLIDDVAYSRIYLGLHYPSDNEFAKEVGEAIMKNKEFTKKYEI